MPIILIIEIKWEGEGNIRLIERKDSLATIFILNFNFSGAGPINTLSS